MCSTYIESKRRYKLKRNEERLYPGKATRLFSEVAQCLKTSSENPPIIIPGVAKRTQGPGACIKDRSKLQTATSIIG